MNSKIMPDSFGAAISSKAKLPKLLALIGWLVFVSVLFLLIDGALAQFQMAITHGYFSEGPIRFKFIILLGATICTVAYGWNKPDIPLYIVWYLFVFYALIVVFYQETYTAFTPVGLLIGYIDNFSLLIFLPLIFSMNGIVDPRAARKIIFIIFVPLAILGIAQFVTSLPLVRPASLDGRFVVNSWTMSGHARAFSLFTSGLRFGYFIAMVLSIAFASYLAAAEKESKWRFVVILLLSSFACLSTLTRNVYVISVEGAITTYLLCRRPLGDSIRTVKLLPIFYLLFAFLLTVVTPAVVSMFSKSALVLSGDSLAIRLNEWQYYLAVWLQTDIKTMLFGTGMSQMTRFVIAGEAPVIDNIFIGVGLQIGVVGLVLFVSLYWALWLKLLRELKSGGASPMLVGITGFWSTAFSSGMFNTSQPTYLSVFVLGMLFFLPENKHRGS